MGGLRHCLISRSSLLFACPYLSYPHWRGDASPFHLESHHRPVHSRSSHESLRTSSPTVWTFPEDDEGNLDVDNGEEGERPCELKMKYEKEGRYAFACVAKAADGETKREVVLTYTGEWM